MKRIFWKILYTYYCHEIWMISKTIEKPLFLGFYLATIGIWFILPFLAVNLLIELLAQYIDLFANFLNWFRSIKPAMVHVPMYATILIVMVKWFSILVPIEWNEKTYALNRINKISSKLSNLDKKLGNTNNA